MTGAVVGMMYALGHPDVGGFSAMMSNPVVQKHLSFIPDVNNTDLFVAIFVIPIAIQWWNVWYAHHLVEVVGGEDEALDDMEARLGLREVEAGAPRDHLEAVVHVAGEVVLQAQHLRPPADDRQQDRAEGRLQLRVLVEVGI